MTVKRTKRRQDRRRHHQRAQSDVRKEHDRKVKEEIENVRELLGAIDALASDPDSTPTAFADRLSEALSGAVTGTLFGMPLLSFYHAVGLAEDVDAERALAIANELASRTQIDVRLAWVGAGFAFGAGERYRADDILTAATEESSAAVEAHGLDEGSDPISLVAKVKIECGRIADALELLDLRCADRPDDQLLQDIRASVLAQALSRSIDPDMPSLACSCGSGRPWSDCCSDRERAALDRFNDRSMLYELRGSLADFVADRPHLARWLQGRVTSWIDEVRDVARLGEFDELGSRDTLSELGDSGSRDANEEDPFVRFAIECSWISTPDNEGPDDDDYDDEDDSRLLISQFASDPSTPEHLKNAARAWLEEGRYGLWQVEHPDTIPGLWLTDLVSRQTRYVAAPEEQIENLPRWSVLLGGVFPIDGVWRTGGVLIAVDPLEADRLTDKVCEMTEGVAIAIATEQGLKVPPPRRRAGSGPSGAPPYGVMASVLDEMEGFEARLHSQVVLNAMPELVGLNERSRRAAPRLTNTDGDPLELLTAVVAVEDPRAVFEGLARHRDFETSQEESVLTWMGREMTPEEAAQSLAQFRAEAAKRGFGPIEEPEGPKRWIRGHLTFKDESVVIEVNSQKRLERITPWLRREGVTAEPVVERKLNPSMDLGVPAGRVLMKGADSPEAEDAWRRHWLDEKVPALDGATPRRAASSESKRALLERLLRQFEHDGDVARSQGDEGVDVGWLRSELDMEDWAAPR